MSLDNDTDSVIFDHWLDNMMLDLNFDEDLASINNENDDDDKEVDPNEGIKYENTVVIVNPPPSNDNPIRPQEAVNHHEGHSFSPSAGPRVFIEEHQVRAEDVKCGREFTGTDHQGNVQYLQMIAQYWAVHQTFGNQHRHKTAIRNGIISEIIGNGGRFIRRARDGQRWELLTLKQVQAKVSQALRDPRRNNRRRNANRRPNANRN